MSAEAASTRAEAGAVVPCPAAAMAAWVAVRLPGENARAAGGALGGATEAAGRRALCSDEQAASRAAAPPASTRRAPGICFETMDGYNGTRKTPARRFIV